MAKITYQLSTPTELKVDLYNLQGQRVRNLFQDFQFPGNHEMELSSRGLEGGTYLVRFQTGSSVLTRKVVIAE